MKKLNVIIVYNNDESKLLFCKRRKEPYKGKFNLVGGKVEHGERNLTAAYRELEEETGIKKDNIKLTHLMNFSYMLSNIELQVYVGKLNSDVKLIEEVNELCWMDTDEDFFDINKFAGEGNIGHMLEHVKYNKETLVNQQTCLHNIENEHRI